MKGTLRADGRWAITLTGYNPRTGQSLRKCLYADTQEKVLELAKPWRETTTSDWIPARLWQEGKRLTPPTRREHVRYVYFIWAPDLPDPVVKVGIAFNVKARLRDLRIGSPVRLEVLHTHRGTMADEAALHDALGDCWSHGEWFKLTPALKELIEVMKSNPRRPLSELIG